MKKNENKIFYWIGIAIFVGFIFVTLWGENGILKLIQLNQTKSALKTENNRLLHQNFEFVQEIKRQKDLFYIEQKARSHLGMVRDNERVYIVKPEN